MPIEGIRGYGDLVNYYSLASLGTPFIDYWVEYPPIFPFISFIFYRLSSQQEHIYDYLMVILFSIFQAGSIWMFLRLESKLYPQVDDRLKGWFYTLMLLSMAYGWWYFDSIVVFLVLCAIDFLIERKLLFSWVTIVIGTLTKWFPILALVIVWLKYPWKCALKISALVVVVLMAVYGILNGTSPEFTNASLCSQLSKGSWETIWALIDGNLRTGNFGPLIERLNPMYAYKAVGNSPRIPSWITLLLFCVVGLWLFRQARLRKDNGLGQIDSIAFLGLTWCLFFLWSPGFSPQWIMYLLPLILLALPDIKAILMTVLMTLVCLLEWPILLSRGYFWTLWFTIPLRSMLFVLLAVEFWKATIQKYNSCTLSKFQI